MLVGHLEGRLVSAVPHRNTCRFLKWTRTASPSAITKHKLHRLRGQEAGLQNCKDCITLILNYKAKRLPKVITET